MMRFIGLSAKTLAILLCILSLGVILILNTQLKSSPRHRTRYETRHTLSVPLTIDLSKNITYISLPDANNELHRYKLERVQEGEPGDETERSVGDKGLPGHQGRLEQQGKNDGDEDVEEEFGDRLDDGELGEIGQKTPGDEKPTRTHAGVAVSHQVVPIHNASIVAKGAKQKMDYLLRVKDPRYSRMIGKVLSKLPTDVRKDMSLNIRMAEAKSGMDFPKIPANKQWEIILKVFGANGYAQRFPDVINIGVKKSGTNALGFFLPQHPQIVHSIGNEVHYFDWMYDKGLDYYKSRMGFCKPDQLVFEKTPRYFVTPEAPGRIKEDLPTAPKFLLCVRDPIARLISDFRHESELKLRKDFKANRLKYSSRTGEFEGQRLKREILDSRGQVNASNELVQTSLYIKHFRNWLGYYPSSRIHVVDQDSMEKDVYQQMKRLEDFLGIRSYFKTSMFYFDNDKKATCMRLSHFGPRNCPAKSTPSVLPKAILDPEILQKLEDFYRPFNKEFSELTGMDFSWAN